jgi:type I restriction-modification system DNA methylase subunit
MWFPMADVTAQIDSVREGLLRVGFPEDQFRTEVAIPGRSDRVPLVAFSNQPFDSRTASVAVVLGQQIAESEIASLRPLGAPLVFRCLPNCYEMWKQGVFRPAFHLRLEPQELASFFEHHRRNLAPESIYRAKVWGRLDHSFQLDFVDTGLLPLVEEESGQKLTQLMERLVAETKDALGWAEVSEVDGRWLLQATFWLLAAKILQDKAVPGFVRLELTDVEQVYSRLGRHYNREHPRPVQVRNRQRRLALVSTAEEIKAFAHCGLVSTEALAHLYESALINRTTRQKLGTHSTPTWLVDYIVGRLRPWVELGIAVEDRKVFEPACGHAGFLIAAMRLLSELLPTGWHQPRHTYLRERLHGIEVDGFALEIARLSLTLADVPNPNGWALAEENMFKADRLADGVRGSTIVLGNPPFENFDPDERQSGWLPNKAAETFRHVVAHMPPGGVFGFVLPQTFLRARQANEVRRVLLRDYEIAEVSLFADKVFRYGEPESSVLIGRRLTHPPTHGVSVRYRRIREGQIDEFRQTYEAGTDVAVQQDQLANAKDSSMLVPDLNEVWQVLAAMPRFEQFADIGKGFDFKGDDDASIPKNVQKMAETPGGNFVAGFSSWRRDQMTHQLPKLAGLNLSASVIASERRGTTTGIPQVLLNYARVSREAWRLKAIIDSQGHPVTSRFLVVRPKGDGVSLAALWALCNSPVANAYAYCLSGKRDILAGDIRQMPVPDLYKSNLNALEHAVTVYLNDAEHVASNVNHESAGRGRKIDPRQLLFQPGNPSSASEGPTSQNERLKSLHWRIDAEVLQLYNLPSAFERRILDLFRGIRRRGVPFDQTAYFSRDFTDLDRLGDLLAITIDWPKTNRRRARLMDLEEAGELTATQATELQSLQRLADASVSLTKPGTTAEIDRVVENLKRRGVWTE